MVHVSQKRKERKNGKKHLKAQGAFVTNKIREAIVTKVPSM